MLPAFVLIQFIYSLVPILSCEFCVMFVIHFSRTATLKCVFHFLCWKSFVPKSRQCLGVLTLMFSAKNNRVLHTFQLAIRDISALYPEVPSLKWLWLWKCKLVREGLSEGQKAVEVQKISSIRYGAKNKHSGWAKHTTDRPCCFLLLAKLLCNISLDCMMTTRDYKEQDYPSLCSRQNCFWQKPLLNSSAYLPVWQVVIYAGPRYQKLFPFLWRASDGSWYNFAQSYRSVTESISSYLMVDPLAFLLLLSCSFFGLQNKS